MSSSSQIDAVVENDFLRSQFVFGLIADAYQHQPRRPSSNFSSIPRTLIQYWHDFHELPEDVNSCLSSWDSWLKRNRITRALFDDVKAKEFIANHFDKDHSDAFRLCHHPAMRCDYFRLCYLSKNGGFYLDADEEYQGARLDHLFAGSSLKLQPLCFDLSQCQMVSAEEFLCEKVCSDKRIYYINNNPLIAPKNHPVIQRALDQSTRKLLNTPKPHDIQATTGPGNLTAGLVGYCIENYISSLNNTFEFIFNWDSISLSKWPLSYRSDDRNWRLWIPPT